MLSIILLSIIFFLSIVWLMFRRGPKQKFDVPGVNASDPQLGNLGDIGQAGSLHEYLTKLHQKYGSIASFYWGKDRVVSIASPEAFHETRRLFDHSVILFSPFEPLFGPNSIDFANGDVGRYRRKHHHDAALSSIAIREHLFDIFQRILHEKMISWQSNEENRIALHAEMLVVSFRSIIFAVSGSSTLFGDEESIAKAYSICWREAEMIIKGQPMDLKRETEFKDARNYILQKVKEIIADRRLRVGNDHKCFIDYLVADEENIGSEENICDEVITMVFGGFHTTGNLLTWILYYLAKDPNVQQRLFDELVQTYDTEFPSCEQIDKMSYLSSVINESLRLSVLAPWSSRVSMDEEIVICGQTIPANTPIIQALGVVLHDEKIWSNPHDFNPDRFDEKNKKKVLRFAFSPFGVPGKRMCPGHRYAHYGVSLFVAGIVRAFKITLVDPTSPVVPVYGLVTAPKDEIFVQFNPRN